MKQHILAMSALISLGFVPNALAGSPDVILAIPSDLLISPEVGTVYLDEYVEQTNINSPVTAHADVSNNWGLDETNIDVTAVGNNVAISVANDDSFNTGINQSNINSAVTASATVNNNWTTPDAEIFVDVTAVGNNISIDQATLHSNVGATLTQVNDNSPVSAIGTVNGNWFGAIRPRDPDIDAVAVGNNASINLDALNTNQVGQVTAAVSQANVNSPVTAVGQVSGNRGLFIGVGIVNVSATAVGNNLNISTFEDDDDE